MDSIESRYLDSNHLKVKVLGQLRLNQAAGPIVVTMATLESCTSNRTNKDTNMKGCRWCFSKVGK